MFPWLRRFGKFPIYIHVLYVLAKGDLIGHSEKWLDFGCMYVGSLSRCQPSHFADEGLER